jgi:tRNA(Ile)-lysidine synthase
VERADVSTLARQEGLAIEETARRARYAFLARVALATGARTIAVGHNADDQTETILMHFLRGSGLAGLRGMLPLTSLQDYRLLHPPDAQSPAGPSTHDPISLIRPLLAVTRAQIEAYCQSHRLQPRFDRSNLDTTYYRNWLRHDVLPLLARHNPNISEVIRRSARVITDDYALLRTELETAWPGIVLEEVLGDAPHVSGAHPDLARAGVGAHPPAGGRIIFDLGAWRALPTSLQRSTLREAIHRLRRTLRDINFLHVENALFVARDGTTGDQATLPNGLMLTMGYDRFTLGEAGAAEPLPDWPLLVPGTAPLPVAIPGDTPLPNSSWLLRAELLDRPSLPAGWETSRDPWRAFLDAGAVGAELWLRTRRPGDRFQPQGMGGHSTKLGDFYTNQKVPRATRDRLPLLDAGGQIAWVCGWRVDKRAKLGERAERVLALHFLHGE